MSTTEHQFTCPSCLTCVRCGSTMLELYEHYRPCRPGPGHYHPSPESPKPYVPEWAVPLARPADAGL